MNNKEDLMEATIKALNESKTMKREASSYTEQTMAKCKEENEDFYNLYTQLKEIARGGSDSIDLYGSTSDTVDFEITVSLYTEAETNIYGTIYSDKTCKITTSSGPNILEPSFVRIVSKMSELLKGYEFLPY